ncbi:PEP-CTERM sorting domain-containing protein [Prosthecobacter sp.]|uniref:PEP-CTERM sorting domain-containing protein n=1 Tax=Prosthecobacter sp. TaxID=1965333 RepID=UPI002489E857|nr:PEP-CTERM sorting domain-containing protein [Prosthecobacter sp.]MDI1313051.1 PEP-CTERM sorting domain-containing protein [Prosthecobacter sp.]
MNTPFYLLRLLCLALALAWTHGAQASTVFWGNNVDDPLYDSAGASLDATYTFQIGVFTGGFTPTYQNVDQWETNWHLIDLAFDPDENGWNVPGQFYGGTIDFLTDGTAESTRYTSSDVYTQGTVVYLWAFNSKTIVPSSEWALVTDGSPAGDIDADWIIPDPLDTDGAYNWTLLDANSAIIGGVNGVQGPGTYSTTPSPFSLQTAVVPEPGSALLLLAAAVAHLTRRFRRTTSLFLP